MIHLIKNTVGKFDVVVVSDNGRLLMHSRQAYTKKTEGHRNIRRLMKTFKTPPEAGVLFQDDTSVNSKVLMITKDEITFLPELDAQKKYDPINF